MRIDLDNGKYTIIRDESKGCVSALRYGETWRELSGDALVLSMMHEIHRLRQELEQTRLCRDQLQRARQKVLEIERIPWGYEGDGGAEQIANQVDDLLAAILDTLPSAHDKDNPP